MIAAAAVLVLAAVMLLAARAIRSPRPPGWLPRLNHRLLDRAVERLPPDHRERYAQEWAADLAHLGTRPVSAMTWAFGLGRAASKLAETLAPEGAAAPRRSPFPIRLTALPQLALDAGLVVAAYFLAYKLRFQDGVPRTYELLFWDTVAFAGAGGVLVFAAFGLYRDATRPPTLRICQAVFVTVLAVVAYVALVHPRVVSSPAGVVPLMLPAGIAALFGPLALALLVASRFAVRVVVTRRA